MIDANNSGYKESVVEIITLSFWTPCIQYIKSLYSI